MNIFRKRKIKKEKEKMELEQLQQFKEYQKKGYVSENLFDISNWICETFPKMLREFASKTHGAPELNFEEIECMPLQWVNDTIGEINRTRQNKIEVEAPFDIDNLFDRWELILYRMAYCFERANEWNDYEENEYREEYFKQLFGADHKIKRHESFKKWFKRRTIKVEGGYQLIQHEPDKELEKKYFAREYEIEQNKVEYKDEAMRLLSKYFYSLWD